MTVAELEFVFKLRDSMSPAMATVSKTVEAAAASMKTFTDAEQRAELAMRALQNQANRMNTAMRVGASGFDAMHSEALKMNEAYGRGTQRAGTFADSVGRVSTTLARSADAFGLPVGALRSLDDVADVAELGLKGLGTGAASTALSFSTLHLSMLGPIAAAAAIGAALGTLLNKFEFVRKGADALVATFERLFTGMSSGDKLNAATAGLADFSAKMGASHTEAQKKQVEGLKAMHVPLKDIAALYKDSMTPEMMKQLGITKEQIKLDDERVSTAKKLAEQRKAFGEQVKRQTSDRMIEEMANLVTMKDMLKVAPGVKKGGMASAMVDQFTGSRLEDETLSGMLKIEAKAADVAKRFSEMAQSAWDAHRPIEQIKEELIKAGATAEQAAAAVANIKPPEMSGWDKVTMVLGGIADMFGSLAGDGEDAFARISRAASSAANTIQNVRAAGGLGTRGGKAAAFEGAGDTAASLFSKDSKVGGALAGAGKGAAMGMMVAGPYGAAIGAVAGAVVGFIAKGKALKKELATMKQSFIDSAGGMDALKKKAAEAGVSLDAMFKAKNKDALLKAIDQVKSKLDTWDEAHEKLQAAVEKYGFTVEELGPKFRQQELDTMAGELLQDYELLKASGIDNNLILSKMAPNMSEYIQTAIRAGTTVPEAMRPAIEMMIQNGQLLDENGQAYASAEAAGITFAQTMSEQFSTLIQKIGDLVAALTGIPNVSRDVTINTRRLDAGPGTGGDNSGVPEDYRAAAGFHATVSRPTRILVGEAGSEDVDVSPHSKGGRGAIGGTTSVTFAPVFQGDPLQSNEARRDLTNYQIEQFFRSARNSPLMRNTLSTNGRRR